MKLYRLILMSALTVASVAGCGKWLDITPEDSTTEKDLFADFGGYRSAINGIYQTLASSQLYGENLSWGFLSALSQYYNNTSTGNTKRFSYTEKYDYASEEVKSFGEEIWSQGYFVIANCNNVIQHLDNADPAIFPYYENGEMDMIRGEALAVRAMMHFDLLRLFADAPAVSMDGQAIPYSETYPDMFPKRLTTRQVLDKVISDLKTAASLLEKIDADDSGHLGSASGRYMASNSGQGLFFSARGFRLNYVAVMSLLARVYAYAGDMETAYGYASDIIKDYVDTGWYLYTPKSQFSSTDTELSRPHKLVEGVLAALYSETLVNDYVSDRDASQQSESNPYRLKNLDNIFNDVDDIRRTKLIVGQTYYVSIKYTLSKDEQQPENYLVPIMRLSEIDLLRAEYLASKGSVSEAVEILNALRQARGCVQRVLDPASITEADLENEIEKEVWRENVGEGQYFFFCKRKNLPTINNDGVFINMEGRYTMQIPDSETSLN